MTKSSRKPGSGDSRRGAPPPRRPSSPKQPPARPSRPVRPSGSPSASRRPSPARPAAPPSQTPAGPKNVSKIRPAARRPAARAEARRAIVDSRPLPQPPRRRIVTAAAASSVVAANQELATEVSRIQSEFASLEGEAQLSDIYSSIGDLDARLVELPTTLDSLRDRGYVHSRALDQKLEALDDHWDELRPRVERALQDQIRQLDRELDGTEQQVKRLRANAAAIRGAETAVNGLSRQISAAKAAVRGLYEGIELELSEVGAKISVIGRMLDLIDESQEFRLLEAEGPLLAVPTVWQRDGKDGPEGVLFLTDQRLLFEQRKEVVTKKLLGLFKTESEDALDLLLDVQVGEVESVSHKEEGGFLGMGKDDILEFVFSATAPVSRARFHLKGQDSADWASVIKRVQTGEIDDDRADEYVEELEEAEIVAASFPELCPNCFAAVPELPRGTSSHTCEFCGTVITPTAAAE